MYELSYWLRSMDIDIVERPYWYIANAIVGLLPKTAEQTWRSSDDSSSFSSSLLWGNTSGMIIAERENVRSVMHGAEENLWNETRRWEHQLVVRSSSTAVLLYIGCLDLSPSFFFSPHAFMFSFLARIRSVEHPRDTIFCLFNLKPKFRVSCISEQAALTL
jgi:hypothetical protein